MQSETVAAQDFVRSIERALSPKPRWMPSNAFKGPYFDNFIATYLHLGSTILGARAYGTGHAPRISGLDAPDDHTLVIHLTKPSGSLGYALSSPELAPIPPVPSHPEWRFGAAQGHTRLYFDYMVSTGPYMIEGASQLDFSKPPQQQLPVSGDNPDGLTLVPNPSWDPASDPLRPSLPHRIEFVPVKDLKATRRLIKRGVIDYASNWDSPPRLISQSSTTTLRDYQLYLVLNLALRPFDDVHVRRAVNFAIARRPLARLWDKLHVLGAVETHIGLDDQENNLLLNYDPYHAATGDLPAARREMAKSPYDSNHDGRCDRPECHVVMWAYPSFQPAFAMEKRAARDLARIGLKVHIRYVGDNEVNALNSLDPLAYQRKVHPQIDISNWLKNSPSPGTYFDLAFGGPSFQASAAGNLNPSHVGSPPAQLKRWGYHITRVPSVDDRITHCSELTFGAQTQCYAQLDQYLTWQLVPWVPLANVITSRVTSSRVTGFNFDNFPVVPLPSIDRVALRPKTHPAPLPPSDRPVPPIPDGVYRFRLTTGDFRHFDAKFRPNDFHNQTGQVTVYLRHGTFEYIDFAPRVMDLPMSVGIYSGTGHHATFQVQEPLESAVTAPPARWSFDGHAIHFKLQGCAKLNHADCAVQRTIFEAHPWVKVAALP